MVLTWKGVGADVGIGEKGETGSPEEQHHCRQ